MRAASTAIRSRIRCASASGVRTAVKSTSGTVFPGVQRPKRGDVDDEGPADGVEGDFERLAENLVALGVRGPLKGRRRSGSKCGHVYIPLSKVYQ